MCGIVGYVGKRTAAPILLEGLRRLEYRGYDSAGISVFHGGDLQTRKKKGKIDDGLAHLLIERPVEGVLGLGHTRWATHGAPSDENSHPHCDRTGRIAVVHNGVIENYERLRERLREHEFHSSTDTEVLAHLIGVHYEKTRAARLSDGNPNLSDAHPLAQAVTNALREVIGAYGIAVICSDFPDVIVAARRGSPLIVGVGNGENFIASDATAIAPHTNQVIYLNDYDVVTLTADRFLVGSLGSDIAKVQISQLEFDAGATERGNFPHFMLKEIFEQPQTVRNALRGRIDSDKPPPSLAA
jgi:glucosamine--fructose-6-phosphate aminotransferase (isomerizing)